MWELAEELLREMYFAQKQPDWPRLHELTADLIVVVKRGNPYPLPEGQVPAPPEAVTLINQLMQRSLE
jgi:hypothetical protein